MGTGVTLSTKSPENFYWSLAFGLGSLIEEQESKAQDQILKPRNRIATALASFTIQALML
jgi:hypothetical protein